MENTHTDNETVFRYPPPESVMQNYQTSLNLVTALLNLQSRPALVMALASVVVKSGSCIETTLELTNRVCDRYFPGK
jgi:hypothetical protein